MTTTPHHHRAYPCCAPEPASIPSAQQDTWRRHRRRPRPLNHGSRRGSLRAKGAELPTGGTEVKKSALHTNANEGDHWAIRS